MDLSITFSISFFTQTIFLHPAEFGADDMDTGADMDSSETKVSTSCYFVEYNFSFD